MPLRLGNCHLAFHLGHAPLQALYVHARPSGWMGAQSPAPGSPQGRPQTCTARLDASERLSAGACSVGAGPTGGTNAFDLRSALLSAAHRPPRTPAWPLRARTLPLALAGSEHRDLGSEIWGPGGGRGPGREGCRTLARLRETRPLLAAHELTGASGRPCSLPAILYRQAWSCRGAWH